MRFTTKQAILMQHTMAYQVANEVVLMLLMWPWLIRHGLCSSMYIYVAIGLIGWYMVWFRLGLIWHNHYKVAALYIHAKLEYIKIKKEVGIDYIYIKKLGNKPNYTQVTSRQE